MTTSMVETHHPVVSPTDWLRARKEFLKKEKEFTRLRDELSRQRRELPWERVQKEYFFEGPKGQLTLADLFENRSQLLIYHFMLGPGWGEGCPSCSMIADGFDGMAIHLAHRDVTLAAVSRAPYTEIQAFKRRMGWAFPWASSYGDDFNRDFHVSFSQQEMESGKVNYNYAHQSFPSEEAPGASVFFKDKRGDIFHTYSTYGRGLDHLMGVYHFLDIVPKGRDEQDLSFSMAWVRHHDKYGQDILPKAVCRDPEADEGGCCHSK